MPTFKKVNLIITPLFSLPVNTSSEERSGMFTRARTACDMPNFGQVEGKERCPSHPPCDTSIPTRSYGLFSRPDLLQSELVDPAMSSSPESGYDRDVLLEQSHSVRFPTRILSELESITLRLPSIESKPTSRRAARGAILYVSIIAAAVLTVYLVIPLVFTLIPLLPTNGSRILIAIQLLLLAELVIYCILRRTTSTRGQSNAGNSAL